MSAKKLIIYLGDTKLDEALEWIKQALPVYYECRAKDDRRLTIRFDEHGTMAVYHDVKDLVGFRLPVQDEANR